MKNFNILILLLLVLLSCEERTKVVKVTKQLKPLHQVKVLQNHNVTNAHKDFNI